MEALGCLLMEDGMTIEQFCDDLKALSSSEWGVMRSDLAGSLRLCLLDPSAEECVNCFCPLTAVYYDKTGRYVHESRFQFVGSSLGCHWEHITLIVEASDHEPNFYSCDSLMGNIQDMMYKSVSHLPVVTYQQEEVTV